MKRGNAPNKCVECGHRNFRKDGNIVVCKKCNQKYISRGSKWVPIE